MGSKTLNKLNPTLSKNALYEYHWHGWPSSNLEAVFSEAIMDVKGDQLLLELDGDFSLGDFSFITAWLKDILKRLNAPCA